MSDDKIEKIINIISIIIMIFTIVWITFISILICNMIKDHKCWLDGYNTEYCQKYVRGNE